ncbi:hypothetical protein B0H14DRAFT_3783878 [Mycena olivaceomarginata]|nr:hypothetical protein B0H14DRAFT_3783878 [Mycena olivaceomarginata]
MQNHYNVLHREEEREMMPSLKHFGVGSIPWSPLARGALIRPAGAATSAAEETLRQESDELSPMCTSPSRFGGFKVSNHEGAPLLAIHAHVAALVYSARRIDSVCFTTGMGMRRGESCCGASHRSLRTVLPFVVPAGATRATPNSESLARPVTRIALRVLSIFPDRFLISSSLRGERETWCPRHRHPLHAYRYYNDTMTRGGAYWRLPPATHHPRPPSPLSSKHSLTRHGLLTGSSTSGTGWDGTITIDELSKHERGHGRAGRLRMYEETGRVAIATLFRALPTTSRLPFASPPDDLARPAPSALLTLSARAPVPVPSPRPRSSTADGVEPARSIVTASTDLPTHTSTDVAIREGSGPSPARHRAARVNWHGYRARPAAPHTVFFLLTLSPAPARASRFISSHTELETSKIIEAADSAHTIPRAGASPVHTHAPFASSIGRRACARTRTRTRTRHKIEGEGGSSRPRALDAAGMCITSRPRARRSLRPAPVSWSAHPHRTSSLLQLVRHPEARNAPHSHPALHTPDSSTGSASASTPASYTGARRTVLAAHLPQILPSPFFPPLHILRCAERAKSGKRISHASPSSPFADGRAATQCLKEGQSGRVCGCPPNGAYRRRAQTQVEAGKGASE